MLNGKFNVIGVSRAKGEYEGRPYSFTKIFSIEKIDDENRKGFSIQETKGSYDLFEKVKKLPGVYKVDLDLNGNKMQIMDIHFESDFTIGI